MSLPSDAKEMRLRYAGVCRLCGRDLPARAEAVYERSTKTVRCVECPTDMTAGGTAEEAETAPLGEQPFDVNGQVVVPAGGQLKVPTLR
jgi:hypothetical protein